MSLSGSIAFLVVPMLGASVYDEVTVGRPLDAQLDALDVSWLRAKVATPGAIYF